MKAFSILVLFLSLFLVACGGGSGTKTPDLTAPTITIGSATVSLVQGATFTDDARANDNKDGNITQQIATTGSVNTATVGSFTLTYNVSDAAGNSAVTVTRTVTVTEAPDLTAPTITIGSEVVTLVKGTTFTDDVSANDNKDGNITQQIATTGSVDTAVVASYTLTYNVLDAAGNPAVTVTRTVTVTEVPAAKNISINILEVSGAALSAKATLNFAGVEVLDQGNAVTTVEKPSGQFVTEVITAPVTGENDLKVMVKADGYVDTGTTIQLSDDQSDYKATVYVVKDVAGKVSEGIFTHVEDDLTGIAATGITTQEITLELEESSTTPKLMVTIPNGTQLMDEEGNPVIAKSASIVRFDPSQENVLNAYPGGLNVQADVGGVMEQVDFKSAGFASIVLKDEAGKKVKSFDKDITIAMQFRIGTTDGDGKIVAIDDIVPIWSYNEDKGTWTFEEDGIVKDLNTADDLYDVVYDTNHLTYFNLDWKTDVCDARIELKDNGNVVQNNVLKVVLKLNDYNVHESFIYSGDGFIELWSLPDSRDWEIQFLDPVTNEVIDSQVGTTSICGDRTISVDLASIGNLPVTSTEIGVNLYCGTNLQQTADVFIRDENNFLTNYGISINTYFDLRTGSDGVLNIYDLPRSFFDQVLNVNVYASDVDKEIVQLALNNTPGTFPVKIGSDKSVNEIKLVLPESYCNAGGFSESTITATLTCPTGLIPNTQLQTAPFVGTVQANISPVDSTVDPITELFSNGNASLTELLSGADYALTLTPFDPTIAQHITNNVGGEVIMAGVDKTYDFILTDAYCNGEVEDTTYTYTNEEGAVVIETPHINTTGSIDLKDYLPTQSGQLNYKTYSLSSFSQDQVEYVDDEVVNITVVGNKVTEVDPNGNTEYIIESDRIRVVDFDKDENGVLQKIRDGAFGRLYDVGGQMYTTDITGTSEYTFDGITTIIETDLNHDCIVEAALSSFTQKGFSYTGDIIKLKCDFFGTITFTTTGSPESIIQVNQTDYIYLEKDVGEIASIEENCIPEGNGLPNNTPGCTVNDYEYRFLVE